MSIQMSKPFKGTLALATAFSLLMLPVAGTATASTKPGMKKAPAATARVIITTIVPGAQTKCFTVKVTRSRNSWGAFNQTFPAPRGCPNPGDGFAVVKKQRGKWRTIPIANNASCSEVSSSLRAAGSSRAVTRDFLKGYFQC